jgi:serine/threonine protein phosphatase PrpC
MNFPVKTPSTRLEKGRVDSMNSAISKPEVPKDLGAPGAPSKPAKLPSGKGLPQKKKTTGKTIACSAFVAAPINVIEWITNSVVTIPPVFKANVELSKQPGFFLVASNTHNGITRCYNEDRVKITTVPDQIRKRKISGSGSAPDTLALFSVFDGHGSFNCSQFLSDRLHTALLERIYPDSSKLPSVARGLFQEIDGEFRKFSSKIGENFAGSCACTLVVHNKTLWAVNLGDSRCVVSKAGGSEIKQITFDHKPSEQEELERIVKSGGHVFRVVWDSKKRIEVEQRTSSFSELEAIRKQDRKTKDKDFGPWRVSPGGLSVSRCFGDFECKGGPSGDQPIVVTTDPGVFSEATDDIDFAMIGCELTSGWDFR